MKPAPFDYARPDTLSEALRDLALHGAAARPLAGGQSLLPLLNRRALCPARLIDLTRIEALRGVLPTADGALRIGAATTYAALERDPLVASRQPLLAETLPRVAHLAVRNRGTLGGSLCHADPAAELGATCLALEARLTLASARGTRTLDIDDFLRGPFVTALADDELLVAVELPALPTGAGTCFLEFCRREADPSLVAAAVVLGVDAEGRCRDVRIALAGAGPRALRATQAAALLEGERPGAAVFAAAARHAAAREVDPPSDVHADAAYRRQLVRTFVGRALARAAARIEAVHR